MKNIKLDYTNTLNFLTEEDILELKDEALSAREKLINKTGLGSNYTGWVDWPNVITNEEIEDIIKTAKKIRNQSEYLLVIGIGGSYLGAKAAISMLDEYFNNKHELKIIFVGNTLSSTYTKELLDYLEDKSFSINVISKSGTTTEPAIAFRLFKELLEKKYQDGAKDRIYSTTTNHDSVLHSLTVANGYKEFYIPDDIGGRYSVLTAVGLLPIACCGYDIKKILLGARDARKYYLDTQFMDNEAMLYASIRNILYKKQKDIELLVVHEPKLSYFNEWWKQLYGESEGKNHKGIFPASVVYSTDLHSLGQYVQDGKRNIFETVINVSFPEENIIIKGEDNNYDKLNFLTGKTLDYVAKQAMKGTIQAHVDGGVPNILINIDKIDEYNFGSLAYFFMFACGISGYILGINPFNQEGVEAYKKNMFKLLGKPGY